MTMIGVTPEQFCEKIDKLEQTISEQKEVIRVMGEACLELKSGALKYYESCYGKDVLFDTEVKEPEYCILEELRNMGKTLANPLVKKYLEGEK